MVLKKWNFLHHDIIMGGGVIMQMGLLLLLHYFYAWSMAMHCHLLSCWSMNNLPSELNEFLFIDGQTNSVRFY